MGILRLILKAKKTKGRDDMTDFVVDKRIIHIIIIIMKVFVKLLGLLKTITITWPRKLTV